MQTNDGKKPEGKTDRRVERKCSKRPPIAPYCDSHQYNHLESSASRPDCFQWRDRIGTDIPLAVLSPGSSMNPTANIKQFSTHIPYYYKMRYSG
jgi:hypothetical protein